VLRNWRAQEPTALSRHAGEAAVRTQAAVKPPVRHLHEPAEGRPEHYMRYLQNGFRAAWGFVGTPLRLRLRARTERRRRRDMTAALLLAGGVSDRRIPTSYVVGPHGAGHRPARARQRQSGRDQRVPRARLARRHCPSLSSTSRRASCPTFWFPGRWHRCARCGRCFTARRPSSATSSRSMWVPGGKGVATGAGVFLALAPLAVLGGLVVWVGLVTHGLRVARIHRGGSRCCRSSWC
jgi:hypothetical protein